MEITMYSYLIAFGKRPKQGFLDVLIQMSANDGVQIRAAVLSEGPGCANLAIALDKQEDAYANALTMALMPAKWSGSEGLLTGLIPDTFVDEINGGVRHDQLDSIAALQAAVDAGPDTVFDVRRP